MANLKGRSTDIHPESTNTPEVHGEDYSSETSPIDAVQNYYDLLNNREYSIAWAQFTTDFQNNQTAKNYSEYETWAKSLQFVSLESPITIDDQLETTAIVKITKIVYSMKNGDEISYTNFLVLLERDPSTKVWLINGVYPDY